MNFYETVMGKRFFEGQLPKLTAALESIAHKHQPVAPVMLPAGEDYDAFLSDLYHGSYEPAEPPANAAQSAFTEHIMAVQDALRGELSQEQWAQLERYRSLLDQRHCMDREQAFAEGFRCAMTMLAAGLSHPASRQKSHGTGKN